MTPTKQEKKALTPRQAALCALLSGGGAFSVVDIIRALPIGDPRSEIRNLRNIGVNVQDVWATGYSGTRFKLYFIRKRDDKTE